MEFVKVMEIAKWFYQWGIMNLATKWPKWYLDVFPDGKACVCTKEQLETAERELLAWAEQHPEQTDTKEDKPMKTKVHELLGVEPGEVFRVKGREHIQYKTDADGYIDFKNVNGEWTTENQRCLLNLINNPSLIIRRPAYTPEQVKVMRALVELGYVWLCKAKSGEASVYANQKEPEFSDGHWCVSHITGIASGPNIVSLGTLIKDWTVPLDLLSALRDAGEAT